MHTPNRLLPVFTVLALAVSACGGGDETTASETDTSSETTPTTETETTVAETTEDPTTEDPTTEEPTTEGPTTEDPTTEDPTTEDPTTDSDTENPIDYDIFRINSIEIADPHFYDPILCAADITGMVNPQLSDGVTMDTDDDGKLDLNLMLLYDGFDQNTDGDCDFATGECLVPLADPFCNFGDNGSAEPTSYMNADACLMPDPDHLSHGDIPQVAGPCFTTSLLPSYTLSLGDFSLPLQNLEISATYVGDPATEMTNGILRGFLTEEDAMSTVLPEDIPVVGGR
ncbi:MAG: hypothetical protein ACPG77_19815, partial [Nannocystaceae bacterium]